jgi:tetratricopeptide (TPR) repeat protein
MSVWHAESALTHQRISRWESGADIPSPKYLDALCRLYHTRPDRLGFGHDYSEEAQVPVGTRAGYVTGVGTAGSTGQLPHGRSEPIKVQDDEKSYSARGSDVLSTSGITEKGMPSSLLNALRAVRAQADMLLETESVSATSVDRWERLAREYGCRQLATPLYAFLADAMRDFAELQAILSRRQPLEFQQRLYRVMAQLAGLIGFDIMGTGVLQESRAWFHTARLAADESGDRQLRAWVIAHEGWTYYWDAPLLGRAVELYQAAQIVAGRDYTAVSALAASLEARAYARLGRRGEAMDAIRRAEVMFGRLEPAETGGTRLGLPERTLRYHQENTLTQLGETRAAMDTQKHALKLPHADLVDSAMLWLDTADCLITGDELDEGCRVASQAFLEVPAGSRGGVVKFRAREIEREARSRDSRVKQVHYLGEVLQSS